MKRDKSIELMNRAIAEEMTATNQYMYFHMLLDDMGYELLASYFKRTAIKEMIHIEEFGERILFLKGEVELTYSAKVEKIHDVAGMIEKSKQLEAKTIENYNEWAKECGAQNDAISKKLFEKILAEEEEHFDNFDTEGDNLKNFGDQYLALQSLARSKEIAKG